MIDATIELIAEKGFVGLVLAEVGGRAGYSATLPVHYYKTKEALILKTARQIIGDYSKVLTAELQGRSGLEAIRTFVRTYLRYASDCPQKRRALFMITSEAAVTESLRQEIAGLARNAARDLARFIRDGQAAGQIEPLVDPDAYGTLIFAWLRGVISLWAVDVDMDLDRLVTGVDGTLLHTLMVRTAVPAQ